jgi:hypothetical protein
VPLTAFKALSFYVKSPSPGGILVPGFNFGTATFDGDKYVVSYDGEDGEGIQIGNTWQRIVIPIPAAKPAAINFLFNVWITVDQQGKVLYIDEVKLITEPLTLSDIVISSAGVNPIPGATSEPQYPISNLLPNMKLVYTIDGVTTTLFNRNLKIDNWYSPITFNVSGSASSTGNTMTGGYITEAANGGTFDMTVGFNGKTSNQATYAISAKNLIEIDNFSSGATHVAGHQDGVTGGFNGGDWGWGQMDTNGYFGGGNVDDVRLTQQQGKSCFSFSVNNGDWGGAVGGRITANSTWNLANVDYISFKYYTTTAGNRAVFGLRSGNVGRDEAAWPSTYTVNFTTLNAWTEVKIPKTQFAGNVAWGAVNGWRFFTGGLGFPNHGGGTVFIADIVASEN